MAEANFEDAVFVEPDTDFTEEQIEYLTSSLSGQDMQVAKLLLEFRPTKKLRAGLPALPTLLGGNIAGDLRPNTSETLQEQYHFLQRELSGFYSHLRAILRLLDGFPSDLIAGEAGAELVIIQRDITHLRRRVTYLGCCLLVVPGAPLVHPSLLPQSRL